MLRNGRRNGTASGWRTEVSRCAIVELVRRNGSSPRPDEVEAEWQKIASAWMALASSSMIANMQICGASGFTYLVSNSMSWST